MEQKTMSLEEYSAEIADELHKTFTNQANKTDDAKVSALMIESSVLAALMERMVYDALLDQPKNVLNKNELLKYVTLNYNAVKLSLQNAIADAFSKAMSNFSGKDQMFYCQITMVTETPSTATN